MRTFEIWLTNNPKALPYLIREAPTSVNQQMGIFLKYKIEQSSSL